MDVCASVLLFLPDKCVYSLSAILKPSWEAFLNPPNKHSFELRGSVPMAGGVREATQCGASPCIAPSFPWSE